MRCPLSGQRSCIDAREHGGLSEGRSGAGDEGAVSDLASDGEEDQLVAGGRDPRHQRAADAALAGAYEAHDYDGLIDRRRGRPSEKRIRWHWSSRFPGLPGEVFRLDRASR